MSRYIFFGMISFVLGFQVVCAVSDLVEETAAQFNLTPEQVETLVKAAPYARLSAHVYGQGIRVGEWVVIEDMRIEAFHATAYCRGGNEVAIAFEGTSSEKLQKTRIHSRENSAEAWVNAGESAKDVSTTIHGTLSDTADGMIDRYSSLTEGMSKYRQNTIAGTREFGDDIHRIVQKLKEEDIGGAWSDIKSTAGDVTSGSKNLANTVSRVLSEYYSDLARGSRELKNDTKKLTENVKNLVAAVQEYGEVSLSGQLALFEVTLDIISDVVEADIIGSIAFSQQDFFAALFTAEIVKKNPGKKVVVAGHSLGGRLAQYSILLNEEVSQAYTFNSAPISAFVGLAEAIAWILNTPQEEALVRAMGKTISIREENDLVFLRVLSNLNIGDLVAVDGKGGGHSIEKLADYLAGIAEFHEEAKRRVVSQDAANGTGQLFSHKDQLSANMEIALVLDRSGSMNEVLSNPDGSRSRKITKAKQATTAFVLAAEDNDGIAISSFSDGGSTQQKLAPAGMVRNDLDSVLSTIQSGGATNLGAGLHEAFRQLSSACSAGPRATLLLSDGMNNRGDWREIAKQYANRQWPICTIGFGKDADEQILKAIATETACSYAHASTFDVIMKYQQLGAYIKNESLLLAISDLLAIKGTLIYEFVVSNGAKSMTVSPSWQGSKLKTVLISPDRAQVTYSQLLQGMGKFKQGDTFQMLQLNNPQSGKWKVKIGWDDPPQMPEQVNIVVTEKTDTYSQILAFRPQYDFGQPVTINVEAKDLAGNRKTALRDVAVLAEVMKPGPALMRMVEAQSSNWTMYSDVLLDVTREIMLYDDGMHDDYKRGDGIFGNSFLETDKQGAYLVTAKIKGEKQDGQSVEKSLLGSFQVGPITNNKITTSETLRYTAQAKSYIDESTPYSEKVFSQPVNEMESMQGGGPLDAINDMQGEDPMDSINKILNGR